jgi:hypothetical protein
VEGQAARVVDEAVLVQIFLVLIANLPRKLDAGVSHGQTNAKTTSDGIGMFVVHRLFEKLEDPGFISGELHIGLTRLDQSKGYQRDKQQK